MCCAVNFYFVNYTNHDKIGKGFTFRAKSTPDIEQVVECYNVMIVPTVSHTPDCANSSSFKAEWRILNVNILVVWTVMATASWMVIEEVKGHDGRSAIRRIVSVAKVDNRLLVSTNGNYRLVTPSNY